MLRDAFETVRYPVAGEAAERPLLAGWVLVSLNSFVPVLPLVPFLGYLVRVLVGSAAGDTDPPPLVTDGPALVRLGVGAAVICIAYLVLPVVSLVVTVDSLLQSARVPRSFAETVVFLSGTTSALLLSLLSSYVLPLALAAYGRERRVRAAFDHRTIRSLARSLDVFVGWATTVAVAAVGAAIAAELLVRSGFGPILASFVVAYTLVLGSHRLGVGIARAER